MFTRFDVSGGLFSKMKTQDKKFEKVVKWTGSYDYKTTTLILGVVNIIFYLVLAFVFLPLFRPPILDNVPYVMFVFAIGNIVILLSGNLNKERKVYYREIRGI